MALKERLADWVDLESAEYYLAIELGVFSGDEEWVGIKWIFWSENKLGSGLYKALLGLIDAGVLEHRDEPDHQVRWCHTPDPESEKPRR
ncbi:hypothetical protein VA596_08920 [Amycolatopsis sp., V23-08]|uniref:Uncharacterized protein n=1 Tax=Amycolatopsis heterodermiae TaxID=3110235 RepID=A0ABU5R0E1_9PSEU|nr:hypothetical protein [Amycolatopsis sp., V23-08]MEA5359655.1 hypothetical protein [Amycolatopsis sp., V23-08]